MLYYKVFFTASFLWSLKLVKVKTEGKKYKQKTSLKRNNTEIKIHANPGLVKVAHGCNFGRLVYDKLWVITFSALMRLL